MAKKKLDSDFGITAEYVTDTHQDAFWRVSVREDGKVQTKVLTQEQFANTLRAGTIQKKEKKLFSLGKLPYGYIDAKIASDGTYDICVLYPKRKYGIRYYKDTYRIPYPNVLYIFSVKNSIVQSKLCFAVKDADIRKGISDKTPLYSFPFGNVSAGSGSMCFGNIPMPKIPKMEGIDKLVQLFLNGDVNDDLYSPSSCSTKNCKQFELYRYLEGKKTFPDSILVPSSEYRQGNGKTFGEVW